MYIFFSVIEKLSWCIYCGVGNYIEVFIWNKEEKRLFSWNNLPNDLHIFLSLVICLVFKALVAATCQVNMMQFQGYSLLAVDEIQIILMDCQNWSDFPEHIKEQKKLEGG